MGCISGYCSSSSNVIISKDKHYTESIISNVLLNNMYSDKTNNKFLSLNSSRQENENYSNSFKQNGRHSFSNKELNIPYNPLPFVKLKPKKSIYWNIWQKYYYNCISRELNLNVNINIWIH